MKKAMLAAAAALCAMTGAAAAHASVFNFNYTSTGTFTGSGNGGESAIGTFTTGESNPPGSASSPSLLITGISGTYDGAPITALLPAHTYYKNPNSFFSSPGNDNILYYPTTTTISGQPAYLDGQGVSFSTASSDVNLYVLLGGAGDTYGTSVSGSATSTSGTLTVTPVPEPTSAALLGGALVGLLLLRKRHARC